MKTLKVSSRDGNFIHIVTKDGTDYKCNCTTYDMLGNCFGITQVKENGKYVQH